MLLENKKAKRYKIEKQTRQQQPLISVEIDTSTHFMHYNSGKYTIALILL